MRLEHIVMLNSRFDSGAALDALQRAGITATLVDNGPRLERAPMDRSAWVLCQWGQLVESVRIPHGSEHQRRLHALADTFSDLLTIILGYADIALDSIVEGDAAHPAVHEIRAAAARAAELAPELALLMRPAAETGVDDDITGAD